MNSLRLGAFCLFLLLPAAVWSRPLTVVRWCLANENIEHIASRSSNDAL
jgi:hypothetical protein